MKSTRGYRKGSKSKTMKGKKDFTTKRSSKVFNRRRHYQKHAKGSRVIRRPYHKKGGSGTTHHSKQSKLSAAPVKHVAARAKSSHVPTKEMATTPRKLMATPFPQGSAEWTAHATPKQLHEYLFGNRKVSQADQTAMKKEWKTFMDGKLSLKTRGAALDKMGLTAEGKKVMGDLYNEDYGILVPIIEKFQKGRIDKNTWIEAQTKIKNAKANQLLKNKALSLVTGLYADEVKAALKTVPTSYGNLRNF